MMMKTVTWAALLVSCLLVAACSQKPQSSDQTSPHQAVQRDSGQPVLLAHMETEKDNAPKDLPYIAKARLILESADQKDILKVVAEGVYKNSAPVSFKYAWKKNGEDVSQSDSITDFKRGDTISVLITPFSGEIVGQSRPLGIVIQNTHPRLVAVKPLPSESAVLSFQIDAMDPDGDTLTYALLESPATVTLEAGGILRWNPQTSEKTSAPIKLKVSDGKGGQIVFSGNLTN